MSSLRCEERWFKIYFDYHKFPWDVDCLGSPIYSSIVARQVRSTRRILSHIFARGITAMCDLVIAYKWASENRWHRRSAFPKSSTDNRKPRRPNVVSSQLWDL